MVFSTRFINTLTFILTASAALLHVQACNPAFQGRAVTISNGSGGEWMLAGTTSGSSVLTQKHLNVDNTVGEWTVALDGSSTSVYTIKPVNVAGVAVSTANNQAQLATTAASDSHQKYTIDCYVCGTNGDADGCRIISQASSSCLSAVGPTQIVAPFGCNPRAPAQYWTIIAA
ncbi:hypothetical protein BDV98DRAFT_594903 [Pterulicium gracile]|uniref:Ricin B lectin domain-containing protein n=1 Tax=Pterulicium gracile TaxID=1884261 RepID=A0A5C3QDG4_9AGAR|nr:hypothetical protein BDV98DRAFT_594903 [Pterula gracilis]